MKTPIGYYGGKISLVPTIKTFLPEDILRLGYIEAFAGGLAVLFGLGHVPKTVVINDINGNVANFWKVFTRQFDELCFEIENTLHDEWNYRQARYIYNYPEGYPEVVRAWAFWVLSQLSFGNSCEGSFQTVKNANDTWSPGVKTRNKRREFATYRGCLEHATVLNTDALTVLEKFNNPNWFAYLDPPYVGANQGHYKGYGEADFKALLEALASYQGQFLLSSYPNAELIQYAAENGWQQAEIPMRLGIVSDYRPKIEVLTYNYQLPTVPKSVQGQLFENTLF